MSDDEYPALFRCADDASNRMQDTYLLLIKSEYGLLLLAAVFSMNIFSGATFYAIYAMVFFASIGVLLLRAVRKPEQDWYKCRALAESVKTLTWRYVMHAAPFDNSGNDSIVRGEFRNHLHQIFSENRNTAEKIAADWSADDQVTTKMDSLRGQTLEERKSIYETDRVREQRSWYAKKAGLNRKMAFRWAAVGVVAYLIAGLLAISRIRFPDWNLWPIEPIIVLASSMIGWTQIKRFNELAAAYNVTAHEIGLILPKINACDDDPKFSEFVNEAELAFSREHTLWVARQTN